MEDISSDDPFYYREISGKLFEKHKLISTGSR
jgi:hypothetical protein